MSSLITPINIQQIAKKAKNNTLKHVESSLLPNQLKEIIINDIEEESNSFYFCYASLFTEKENDFIDTINLAGYFYYKYLIATDELVDNNTNQKNTLKHLILSNFYHEESIRLLTNTFHSYYYTYRN